MTPRKDLLDIASLSDEEIDFVLTNAIQFKDLFTRTVKKVPTLRGQTVLPLFYEASTRTRSSFEVAASRLSGRAAGAAIALVNSVGAVGAFAGPFAMGWLKVATYHYSAGLWAIAAAMTLGGLLVYGESSKTAQAVPQAAD